MDGHFVPNISFGASVMKSVRGVTARPFDVHLMIAPADPYLEAFAEGGANGVTVHLEAGPHVHRSLQRVRALGLRAGVAICPATPAKAVEYLLDLADLVLVMTVNPGFGGQHFLESQLPKIAAVRRMIDATGRDIDLEVDGGIAPDTAARAIAAGADVLVAGTAVFGTPDYRANIAALRRGAGRGEHPPA